MYIKNGLRYYMDESGAPYENDEKLFPRTQHDDEFDEMIIRKYNLVEKTPAQIRYFEKEVIAIS